MPTYNAPFSLSQDITENLTAAQNNGNLGALAGGPLTFPVQLTGVNQATPFSMTLPENSLMTMATVYNPSATDFATSLALSVFPASVLPPTPLNLIANPTGTISTVSMGGIGDITGVYDNGVAGVGATFTVDPVSQPLTYDNTTPVADGDRVLFIGQTDQTQNGMYLYNLGTATLTRTADFDTPAAITQGSGCSANNSAGFGLGFLFITSPSVTAVGSDPIVFTGATTTLGIPTPTAGQIVPAYELQSYSSPTEASTVIVYVANTTPGESGTFMGAILTLRINFQPYA